MKQKKVLTMMLVFFLAISSFGLFIIPSSADDSSPIPLHLEINVQNSVWEGDFFDVRSNIPAVITYAQTGRTKSISLDIPQPIFLQRFLKLFPNAFPLLQHLLTLPAFQ